MKKLLSTLLAACMLLSVASCSNSGAANRETTVSFPSDTKNTVNPDISEPNQSIAGGALIPDTTTEETIESDSGSNTYNVRGKDFTISVHLEDYIYKMDGSDYEYFNLEELMNHYGLKDREGEEYLAYRGYYGNDSDDFHVSFLRQEQYGYNEASGHPICGYIDFWFKNYDGYKGLRKITGSGNTDRVFEVNGMIYKGEPISKYCLTWEQLVLVCFIIDDYEATGKTQNAMSEIEKVVHIVSGGIAALRDGY